MAARMLRPARELRRWARGAGLLGAALLLVACNLDAGAMARNQLAEEMRSQLGDYFVDVTGRASNDMPGGGQLDGEIELGADTPPEVFAAAMGALESFEPRARASYRPVGVRANGVTVCFDDPQRDLLLALRERLHASGQSLQGRWVCGRPGATPAGYQGTVAAFVSDTERVRPLLAGRQDPIPLTLTGRLSRPQGSLAGRWDEVPPSLGPTVELLRQRHGLVRVQLDGSVLQVAVDPVADLTETRSAVEDVAGDLEVRLYQGAIDDARQTEYASFGALADEVRALDGVTRVQVRARHLEVRVEDRGSVRAVHDLVFADGRPGTHLEVVVPSTTGRAGDASTYTRHASSEGGHVDLFVTLAGEREVTRVVMAEASDVQQFWLQLKVRTSLEATLPELRPVLRPVLPEGTKVTIFGAGPDRNLTMVVRDRLAAEDLSATRLDVSSRQRLAELWNAAG